MARRRAGLLRARGYAAGLLVVVLALPACTPSSPSPSDTSGTTTGASSDAGATTGASSDAGATTVPLPARAVTDEEALQLVTAMDDALRSGDVEAFLEQVDPALHDAQRSWFEAVRSVPMEVRQLRPDQVVSRTSPDGTVLHVALRHQLTGAESTPVLQQYRWVLRPDASGATRLVHVEGRNGQFAGTPQPWDLGPVAVLEADGVVLLTPEEFREDAERLLPGVGAAARDLLTDLPRLAEGRQAVTVHLLPPVDLASMLDAEVGEYPSATGWLRTSGEDPGLTRLRSLPQESTLSPVLLLDLEVALDDLDLWGEGPGGNTFVRNAGAQAAVLGAEEAQTPVGWLAVGGPVWYELAADPLLEPDLLALAAEAHLDGGPEDLPSVRWSGEEDWGLLASSVSFLRYVEETAGRRTALGVIDELSRLDAWYEDDEVWSTVAERVGRSEDQLLTGWRAWGEELVQRVEATGPDPVEG